jgi:hypothetical protein
MPRQPRPARFLRPAVSAAAAAAALLAACADKATAPDPAPTPPAEDGSATPGTFQLSITRNFSPWRSMRGAALFGEIATRTTRTGFGVALGSTTPNESGHTNVVLFSRDQRGAPGPGTYSLHDATSDAPAPADRFVLVVSTKEPGGQEWTCLGTSGNLTVSSAAGGRLKGSYDGSVSCVDGSERPQAFRGSFTGQYDAARGGN